MEFNHTSVLLRETVDSVVTNPKGIYVDCTLGGAGHAHAVGEMLDPEGMIIGLDQDEDALSVARQRLSDLNCQVLTIPTNFSNLKEALQNAGIYEVDGFIFDLGVSSYQLDTPERGFSYMNDGPLDMRMDKDAPLTAEEVVNEYVNNCCKSSAIMGKSDGLSALLNLSLMHVKRIELPLQVS